MLFVHPKQDKDQNKILDNLILFLFSKSVWLQMVWKLKAEFLRRAITHEDRIGTISHLEKRGHSNTLGHGVGGLENTGRSTEKQESDTMQDERQCQIIFRHRGMRSITKDLYDRKKNCVGSETWKWQQ